MSPIIIITIILGAIVCALVVFFDEKERGWGLIPPAIFGAFVGLIIGTIIWLVGGESCPRVEYKKDNRELVSLKDGPGGIHGSFFLGIGAFSGGGLQYYGYEDLGNDRYKMVNFSNRNIIVENVPKGGQPYFVEIVTSEDKNWEWADWFHGPSSRERHQRYEIHIPKGSILQGNYKLDLE